MCLQSSASSLVSKGSASPQLRQTEDAGCDRTCYILSGATIVLPSGTFSPHLPHTHPPRLLVPSLKSGADLFTSSQKACPLLPTSYKVRGGRLALTCKACYPAQPTLPSRTTSPSSTCPPVLQAWKTHVPICGPSCL